MRDGHTAGANADQRQVVQLPVAFQDFVRDAGEAARDAVSVHHYSHGDLNILTSSRPLRTALKQ